MAQVAVEAATAAVLAINGKVRRQGINAKHYVAPETTRQRTEPSLRQPLFNRDANDGYTELMNFTMEVTNIF